MHSMVRFHLMSSGRWDVATYGIPIPQVDQMPAGLIGVFLMSARLLRKGKTEFTEAQQATVELARYRCFLLGLPQDLLGETPQEIVDLLIARHISLREAYDDETCGALVRGTMDADLFDTSIVQGATPRLARERVLPVRADQQLPRAATPSGPTRSASPSAGRRRLAAAVAVAVIAARRRSTTWVCVSRLVSGYVDARLNARLARLLEMYGHADFVTDADHYDLSATS